MVVNDAVRHQYLTSQATGINAIVGIYPDDRTPEDAIKMSQLFNDHGGMMSMYTRCNQEHIDPPSSGQLHKEFKRPDIEHCTGLKGTHYEHLDEQSGLPKLKSKLQAGETVIGKVMQVEKIPVNTKARLTKTLQNELKQ